VTALGSASAQQFSGAMDPNADHPSYSAGLSDRQARINAPTPLGYTPYMPTGALNQQGPSANGLSDRDAGRRAPGTRQFIRPSTGVSDATAQQKWLPFARAQESGQPV
jgi:hypothetical protein